MREFIILLFLLILIDFALVKCASPGRPTGGPKDTIPPILISSIPKQGSTNFQGNEIILEFNEYINAEKLRSNLIITPITDLKYKSLVQKNRLILKIQESLSDSTTYNFNFFNGVTDLTEQNPAVNLSLAFSTGSFIDSLSVSGKVKDLLRQENEKGLLVGLYKYTDTLNYFTDKPIYFTTTNDSGDYVINYIKNDTYRLLAFDDQNGNQILDSEEEKHAFFSENIVLQDSVKIRAIYTVLQDVKPIIFIRGRSIGQYFEMGYNKYIDSYQFNIDSLKSNIVGEGKNIIRIYKPENLAYGDSTLLIVQAQDSLNNLTTDSTQLIFSESNRKPAGFSATFSTSDYLRVANEIKVITNKPHTIRSQDSIILRYDSIQFYQITLDCVHTNSNATISRLFYKIDPDSIYSQLVSTLPKDTIYSDSVNYSLQKPEIDNPKLALTIPRVLLTSVENDSSDGYIKTVQLFRKIKQEDFGVLKFSVLTDKTHYQFQLLNEQGHIKYESKPKTEIIFPRIEPGNYRIRVLIDDNQDGKWSCGNLLQRVEPESVYLHDATYSIRANFEIEESISF